MALITLSQLQNNITGMKYDYLRQTNITQNLADGHLVGSCLQTSTSVSPPLQNFEQTARDPL
jgi:hypothetical protein